MEGDSNAPALLVFCGDRRHGRPAFVSPLPSERESCPKRHECRFGGPRHDHPVGVMWQHPLMWFGRGMRAACSVLAVVTLVLSLGACGESSEEKALNTVCDARDDIGKQVADLKSLTPATVTADAVTQDLGAIEKDLNDMVDAKSDLSGDRRSEVEAANKEFASSVEEIGNELGSSLSASDAKAGIVNALQQLEASYQKAFAPLNCD
jgi:hypothetical protein